MPTPSASVVMCIADGANAAIGLKVNADGSVALNTGSAMTRPSSSLVVNVADASDATRLLLLQVVV